MKITGTRSYILVEYDDRILKIKGELTMTAFYASLSSIDCWEPPFENAKVTDDEKRDLVSRVQKEEGKDPSRFKVIFED